MADVLHARFRPLLTLGTTVMEVLREIPETFEKAHDSYCDWLIAKISEVCQAHLKELLLDLDLDWATFHYRTRHIRQEWSRFGEWLQIGEPLHDRMKKYESHLQVSRGKAPYFSPIIQEAIEEGKPLKIIFAEEAFDWADWSGNYLHVNPEIISFLRSVTRGRSDQGKLEGEDFDLLMKCRSATREALVEKMRVLANASISEVEIFSWLRNVCRVTLLALSMNDGRIQLPRLIVHIPVYFGENLIGGGAYVGSSPRRFQDDGNALFLSLLTQSLHSSLRIVEEEQRERSIRQLEELSRARAEFVQRISHSLLGPIEELRARLVDLQESVPNEQIDGAIKMSEEIYKAAGETMLAFSTENVDEFLSIEQRPIGIKRFLSTIQFMNRNSYSRKGIDLSLGDVPEDWVFEIDTTSMTEVFMNLLSNALRFARSRVWISVDSADLNGSSFWRISVADDGNAMEPEMVPLLFRPNLYESLRHEDAKSHGFGLYLSRRVAERHGGTLLLNEAESRFTEFLVVVPRSSSGG